MGAKWATTDTLAINMRPYHSQPTSPNWHTPFDKGDLIHRMGTSPNYSTPQRHCRHIHHGLRHHVPTTFLSCYKNWASMWFDQQTMDVLNYVSTFSRQEN